MSKKTITKRPKKSAAKKSIRSRKSKSAVLSDPEQGTWQTLFAVTEHWMSDLKFFNDELRFFRSLVDKYFLTLIEKRRIGSTRHATQDLARLENQRLTLEQKVSEHLRHLTNLIESPFSHDAHECKVGHEALENSIAEFVKDFRLLKQEIFKVAEGAIESGKAKHLLGAKAGGIKNLTKVK